MKIKSKDNIDVKENLRNHKKWFNGVKDFSSVKVEPVEDNTLSIHIVDTVETEDLFGGK